MLARYCAAALRVLHKHTAREFVLVRADFALTDFTKSRRFTLRARRWPIRMPTRRGREASDDSRLEVLQFVVDVLGPGGIGAIVELHGGVAEGLAVHLHHGLAALLEL